VPAALCLVAALLASATHRLDAFHDSPYPLTRQPTFAAALAGRAPVDEVALPEGGPLVPVEHVIRRGETVSTLLRDCGLEPAEAWSAAEALRDHLDLRRIRAGDRYAVLSRPGLGTAGFRFDVPGKGRVMLARDGDGWNSTWVPYQRSVRLTAVSGVLEGSLEESIRRAGGPPVLAFKMAEVLQWDLDFNRDLRRGDRFEVLAEQVYLDGAYASMGDVVALSYDNAGRRHEAFRFGGAGGYYTADGRPLEKMFLRSPLPYSRITSRFSNRRFHPVLKTYRPHYGVDYGAPVGTPVRVTAGGVVTFAGWSKGGGRMVKVRHPNGFLTAYLHLSKFAKGIGPGARVRQGQLIAYTGASGLATGPHLDYRVQHDGRWIDPLTLRNVPAEPIATAHLDRFFAWRDACRRSLELGEPVPELAAPGDGDLRVARADATASLGIGTAGR
jgi:murein DD-endopeptidase MepM/ murein hydrolase activator NlpD